jgi:hypothetical protein
MFWREVAGRPIVSQRLITAVQAHSKEALTDGEIRRRIEDIQGWTVFLPDESSMPVFAGYFLEPERVLLHVVFPPHPDARDPRCLRQVLSSFQTNRGEERVWAAFGLDFTLPRQMELEDVTAVLASQVMRFENPLGESVTIHRYGMLPRILAGQDMPTFFAQAKGRRFLLYRQGEFLKDGKYPGVRLSYQTRGRGGFDALLAPTWEGRVWLWRCDDIKRLYCVDHNARKEDLIEGLVERVRCQ